MHRILYSEYASYHSYTLFRIQCTLSQQGLSKRPTHIGFPPFLYRSLPLLFKTRFKPSLFDIKCGAITANAKMANHLEYRNQCKEPFIINQKCHAAPNELLNVALCQQKGHHMPENFAQLSNNLWGPLLW